MAARMRAFDWSATPLGPLDAWPQSLRTTVGIVLTSAFPMIVLWGDDLTQLYNDAYCDLLGARHPAGLGQSNQACWPEVWSFNAPIYQGVRERGETFQFTDQRLVLQRHGPEEEAYFTLSFSPVRDEGGEVGGVLVTVIETTQRVLAQRQLEAQNTELDARTRALEGFAHLTRDLALHDDALVLIGRAQDVVLSLLPPGYALYFEPQGDLWVKRAQTGDVQNEALQAVADAGLPFHEAGNLLLPYTTLAPYYQDQYAQDTDNIGELVAHLGASATFPVLLEGSAQGVFAVVLFGQLRPWSGAEKAVMETVVRSLGLALERAQQTRQLDEERAALDAFARFTETSTQVTDVLLLAERAIEVLRATLGDVNVWYSELSGTLWKARVLSDNIPLSAAQVSRAGLAADLPLLTRPFEERGVVFLEGWEGQLDGIERSELYSAGAFYPYFDEKPSGLLTMASRHSRAWTERERSIFLAVARSLGLAFERADQTRRLAAQNAELEARTRALEGFANLSRELAVETDRFTLVRRAQEIVLNLLPGGYAVYYEPEAGLWRLKSQVGSLRNDALQAVVEAGLPQSAPSLLTPYRTRQALYQDVYAPGADTSAEVVEHIRAVATLPLLVDGVPVGVFGIGLFEQRSWGRIDQAVLETVLHSLGLALERAQSVALLAQRTQELERSNSELEQFAYIASHDLQAPIRSVTSFAGIIKRKYGEYLDERGQLYLQQIMDSGEHMKRLVDDLLAFSRVHTEQQRLQPLDSQAVFDAVAQRLQGETPQSVNIIRGPLPQVMADGQQLDQLLQNLISNGLKYQREDVTPQVQVSAQREGEWWRFAVQDNGIGIESQYFERIFEIFQRLHGRTQYEGTGIGLAVCKKIVERHGGRLWLESTPGQGSTFLFTLPMVER
jgi:signal transduction histidine kinase